MYKVLNVKIVLVASNQNQYLIIVFSSGGADQSTSHGFVPNEVPDDAGGGDSVRVLGGQQEDVF